MKRCKFNLEQSNCKQKLCKMTRRISLVIFISILLTFSLIICASAADAKLTASDGAADDDFGQSVSISGNYSIVGAYGDDGDKGSAYIYNWDETAWNQSAKLTASDGAVEDYFGQSVVVMF